jgi:hypothetical protein
LEVDDPHAAGDELHQNDVDDTGNGLVRAKLTAIFLTMVMLLMWTLI